MAYCHENRRELASIAEETGKDFLVQMLSGARVRRCLRLDQSEVPESGEHFFDRRAAGFRNVQVENFLFTSMENGHEDSRKLDADSGNNNEVPVSWAPGMIARCQQPRPVRQFAFSI
jgi:hypothetical protein